MGGLLRVKMIFFMLKMLFLDICFSNSFFLFYKLIKNKIKSKALTKIYFKIFLLYIFIIIAKKLFEIFDLKQSKI